MDQVAQSSQMADELNPLNRFGWRMAVPRSLVYSFAASRNMKEDDTRITLDYKLMPNEMSTDDRMGKLCSMPSVVQSFHDEDESRPGHVVLRQYSMIAPKISTTIADIYFNRVEWCFHGISLLGFGHMAAVFRCNTDLRSLRFMVFEGSSSRLARTFDIKLSAPWDDGNSIGSVRVVLLSAYLNDDSTLVVHWHDNRDVGFGHFLDKFEIPKYEVGAEIPVIQPMPMARESHIIPWPHPVYYLYYQKLDRQSYFILSSLGTAIQPLFSYNDDHGRWFYHTLERLQELWVDTPFGHWDVGLLKSLGNLHPFLMKSPLEYSTAYRNFVYLSNLMFGYDDGVSVYRSEHGLMRRWHHNVPSLKISAAESLFRAIPDLDRWELKKAVGFDIFDGMSTVNDEAVQKYSVDGTALAAENEEAQDEEATIEDKNAQGTNEENEAEETSQNDEVHAMKKEKEGTSKKSCCGCVIM